MHSTSPCLLTIWLARLLIPVAIFIRKTLQSHASIKLARLLWLQWAPSIDLHLSREIQEKTTKYREGKWLAKTERQVGQHPNVILLQAAEQIFGANSTGSRHSSSCWIFGRKSLGFSDDHIAFSCCSHTWLDTKWSAFHTMNAWTTGRLQLWLREALLWIFVCQDTYQPLLCLLNCSTVIPWFSHFSRPLLSSSRRTGAK